MRFYEVRWERSAKLASCANGSPVLKINFVLPGNNHNLIPELKASRHNCVMDEAHAGIITYVRPCSGASHIALA